jgi:dTMP kinase
MTLPPPATFIAIEGTDGSGKETQTNLLVGRARTRGYRVAQLAFPRYNTPLGDELKETLHGKYGGLQELDPMFMTSLFVADRAAAQEELERLIKTKDIVVVDRYAAANIAHQAAKYPEEEWEKRIAQLEAFEHEQPYNNRRPDKTLFLNLPSELAQHAMEARLGERDIHEQDVSYQKNVRRVYEHLARDTTWTTIDCMKQGSEEQHDRLSREDLLEKIWEEVDSQIEPNPLQIYFAASIQGETMERDTLRRTARVLGEYGHILTEYLTKDDVHETQKAEAQKTNIYERDMGWLARTNIFVGDITAKGSYGVGRETQAATHQFCIPTVLFFNQQIRKPEDVSRMITHDKKIKVIPYISANVEQVVHGVMKNIIQEHYC